MHPMDNKFVWQCTLKPIIKQKQRKVWILSTHYVKPTRLQSGRFLGCTQNSYFAENKNVLSFFKQNGALMHTKQIKQNALGCERVKHVIATWVTIAKEW